MNAIDLIWEIFELTTKEKYPDIHLNSGSLPIIRNHNWDLIKIEVIKKEIWEEVNEKWETKKIYKEIKVPVLSKEIIKEIITEITWSEWLKKFENDFELDTSYKYKNFDRYRVNCYMDTQWYSVALRIIPSKMTYVILKINKSSSYDRFYE